MDYVIAQELLRQQEQGFIEEKKGKVNQNLSFQVSLDSLEINVEGLRYREDIDFSIHRSGSNLQDLPSSMYSPLHKIVNTVAPIIGEGGLAWAPTFWSGYIARIDDRGWEWRDGEAKDLKSALEAYRFSKFLYQTNDKKSELKFSPNHDPGEPFGELDVFFKIKDIKDLPIPQVRELEDCLRGILANNRGPR